MSKEEFGGGRPERAGWVRTLAAQADDLSSVPGIHGTERENPLLQVVL